MPKTGIGGRGILPPWPFGNEYRVSLTRQFILRAISAEPSYRSRAQASQNPDFTPGQWCQFVPGQKSLQRPRAFFRAHDLRQTGDRKQESTDRDSFLLHWPVNPGGFLEEVAPCRHFGPEEGALAPVLQQQPLHRVSQVCQPPLPSKAASQPPGPQDHTVPSQLGPW